MTEILTEDTTIVPRLCQEIVRTYILREDTTALPRLCQEIVMREILTLQLYLDYARRLLGQRSLEKTQQLYLDCARRLL